MEAPTKALTPEIREALHAWPAVEPVLSIPHDEAHYQRLVSLLDYLIDEVGENESHPLASLMDVIGLLIERYEDEYIPVPT
jgi:HTH-type transcriptional regulator/antitoxin HigA